MGCFNETCQLTRLPIRNGDPVVALVAFDGISADCRRDGCLDNAIFGLPQRGTYDDGGRMEAPLNAALARFTEERLAANRFAKPLEGSRDNSAWLATHNGALVAARYKIARLLGDGPDCFAEADQGVKRLMPLLRERVSTLDDFAARLRDCCALAFGKKHATAIGLLCEPDLLVTRWQPLMHAAAFEAMVRLTGREAAGRITLRSVLRQDLASWMRRREKWRQQAAKAGHADESEDVYLGCPLPRHCRKPLSAPYQRAAAPLLAHFWGTAEPEEVVAVAGLETVIETLLFECGMFGLRGEIRQPPLGGQDVEYELPARMQRAVLRVLRDSAGED